jgi:hypothetical protein
VGILDYFGDIRKCFFAILAHSPDIENRGRFLAGKEGSSMRGKLVGEKGEVKPTQNVY